MNEDIKIRQQYIRSSNELNKMPDKKTFVQAGTKKMEMDRKLEELSISSGVSFSGNVVRQNILNSSVSHATTLNNTFDYEDYKEDDESKSEISLKNGINRGRETLQNMNNFSQSNNELNKMKFNNFNRNI